MAMHANAPNDIAAIIPVDEDNCDELMGLAVGDMSVSTGSSTVTLYPALISSIVTKSPLRTISRSEIPRNDCKVNVAFVYTASLSNKSLPVGLLANRDIDFITQDNLTSRTMTSS